MIQPVRDDVLAWVRTALGGRPMPAVAVVIGLGDGAVIDAVASLRRGIRVLALEPDATVAERLQRARPASPAVRLLAGPDYAGADDAWRVLADDPEDHVVLISPAAVAANREAVLAAARVFGKMLFGARANAEARRTFAPGYLRHTLANLGAMARGSRADALDGRWAGRPAIVVGAGPSLDAVLPVLPALASRAVVIVTDTALRPLLHAGVSPEVVVGADPSPSNGRHFENLPPCDDTWLVAESALDPRAAAAFPGRTAWFRVAGHDPWPWANAAGVDVPVVDMWGSVLTAAWQVALRAGCDPIVFIGADLAYTDGRPYARGTTYEFDWAYSATLGTPIAEAWRQQMAMTAAETLPGVDGRPVASSQPLQAFRDWLVAQAVRSGRRVVNATGGGILSGAGLAQATLEDALRGRPALPRAPFATRPTLHGSTSRLAHAIAGLRRAIAGGEANEPTLARWAAFTGAALDLPALDAALQRAEAALREPPRAATAIAAGAHVPWMALSTLGFPMTRLSRLAEDVLAAAGEASPSRDVVAQALVAGTASAGALTKTAPSATAAAPAALPDPRQLSWPADVAWPLRVLDAVLPGTAPEVPRGFLDRPVTFANHGQPVAATPAAVLRDRLLARLARAMAAHASDVDAARLRGLAAAIDRAAVDDADLHHETVCLAVDGPVDYRARVDVRVTRRAAARALTGTILAPGERAADVALAAWRHGVLDARLTCASAVAVATPDVLSERGLPRGASVYAHDDGAILVPLHGTTSLRLDAEGDATPHLAWPLPIVGELPMGEGAVAWSNGTATWPEIGDGYVLWREHPDGPVHEERLPFRPTAGAWLDGRLHWTLFTSGLGTWAPGDAPAQLLSDRSLAGLVADADGLAIAPLERDAEGRAVRRVHRRGLRLNRAGQMTDVELGPEGGVVASASGAGWTADACLDADEVRLTSDARTCALVCHAPVSLAWIGPTLIVCTAAGDVLRFARLADTLDALR